jgi:hypothetical protein
MWSSGWSENPIIFVISGMSYRACNLKLELWKMRRMAVVRVALQLHQLRQISKSEITETESQR